MFTGNILHQVVLGVTTALSFGFAPCTMGARTTALGAGELHQPATLAGASHKSRCPFAHRATASSIDSDANVMQLEATMRHNAFRARITVSW